MELVAFLIGLLIPILAGFAIYFGYINTRLTDEHLCYEDDKELIKCPNNKDISICAKKGTSISYCGTSPPLENQYTNYGKCPSGYYSTCDSDCEKGGWCSIVPGKFTYGKTTYSGRCYCEL